MAPDSVVVYDNTDEAETPNVEVTVEATTSTEAQWQEIGKRTSDFIADLPNYVTNFFEEYQRPLIVIGLILAAFVVFKLTLALLDAINDIPLVKPTFELIGIAYTVWFVYRYLLTAVKRQELSGEINSFKEQVLGRVD